MQYRVRALPFSIVLVCWTLAPAFVWSRSVRLVLRDKPGRQRVAYGTIVTNDIRIEAGGEGAPGRILCRFPRDTGNTGLETLQVSYRERHTLTPGGFRTVFLIRYLLRPRFVGFLTLKPFSILLSGAGISGTNALRTSSYRLEVVEQGGFPLWLFLALIALLVAGGIWLLVRSQRIRNQSAAGVDAS